MHKAKPDSLTTGTPLGTNVTSGSVPSHAWDDYTCQCANIRRKNFMSGSTHTHRVRFIWLSSSQRVRTLASFSLADRMPQSSTPVSTHAHSEIFQCTNELSKKIAGSPWLAVQLGYLRLNDVILPSTVDTESAQGAVVAATWWREEKIGCRTQ